MRFVKNITSKRHFIIAGSILISFFSVLVLDLFLNSLNERPNIRKEIFFIAFVTGIIVFFTNTWSMKHVFQSINILTDTIKGVIRGKKAIKFPVFPNSELHNLSISIQKLSEINTKLEKKTEQVQHASQQKDMFISSMSHELRTPLNAIIGYSEMLQDEASEANNTEWGEDIRKIHVAGEYLLGMVNNILDISKIEAGKMTVFLEEFNIDTMLSDIRDIANTLMKKNNNTFVMDTPKEIGSMVSDLMKVRQSILNFLSNAAKFTENGVVTLR
ncbi:MAG: hypothetical protein LBH38_02540, partial [Holosporales bacterium]|nr:hypothetical protein [Holosporales bacterium]